MSLKNLIQQNKNGSSRTVSPARIPVASSPAVVEFPIRSMGVDLASGTLPLVDIKDRANGNTRPIDQDHVKELADSFAAVGQIQPIAVDKNGCLLAGGHRKAAAQLLQATDSASWKQHFPGDRMLVRVYDFDSIADPKRALEIEASENEKRRDYSPKQVRAIADRLMNAGYSDPQGRPQKGAKQLTPALMTIVGKSRRTIKGYLSKETPKTRTQKIQFKTLKSRAVKAVEVMLAHPDMTSQPAQEDRQALQEMLVMLESIGFDQ